MQQSSLQCLLSLRESQGSQELMALEAHLPVSPAWFHLS
jgi:hypothetical protein